MRQPAACPSKMNQDKENDAILPQAIVDDTTDAGVYATCPASKKKAKREASDPFKLVKNINAAQGLEQGDRYMYILLLHRVI